ncbi:MAG: hypothetical protein J6J43_04960 [Oscillospiraceae bacterium]|nr:hypothetical protein [Oscillospiraceae bacterium]
MKKLFLIVGIVSIIACVLSLLFAALSLFGYYHVLDGSPEMFARLHRRMILFFVIGLVLAAIGVACLILRRRI